MEYHDNKVEFFLNAESKLRIVEGYFRIDALSITEGQDPETLNRVGDFKSFDSKGEFSFRVGRKDSETNSKWVRDQVGTYNVTTYKDLPPKLNFGFMGRLELSLTGGALGVDEELFVFENIVLAEGHWHLRNNWVLGSTNSYTDRYGELDVRGINDQNETIVFRFRFYTPNRFEITPLNIMDISTSNWLGKVSNDLTLDSLMIPGSHDSGMSKLSHCAPPEGASQYTKTQQWDINTQLVLGVRFFDIRVDYDHNELVTYHRTGKWGCNGQALDEILTQVSNFLTRNSSEFAILLFSHIRSDSGHSPTDIKTLINAHLNGFSSQIYTNVDPKCNLTTVPISQFRGKMILVFDYNDYIDASKGRFRYNGSALQSNMRQEGSYSDTSSYDKMKKDQLQKWKTQGASGAGYMFLLSWTLTGAVLGIESSARKANSHLPTVLTQNLQNPAFYKPNIVSFDFVEKIQTLAIIRKNFV